MGGVRVVVGLTGVESETAGVKLSEERFVRIELPYPITSEHVELMRKDLDVIASATGRDPGKVVELQNAVLNNDFTTARRLAGEMGVNEDALARAGGAQIGVAVAILVVLVILAESTGSGRPAPTPEPVGPNPGDGDAGPGDAGPGDAGPG
jgi:hypothetical protein